MKKKILIILSLVLLFTVSILTRLFELSTDFSEFYTMNIAPFFRIPIAFIFSFLPFSAFESILLIMAVLFVALIFSLIRLTVRKALKKEKDCYHVIYFKILLFCCVFVFLSFVFSFKSCYTRKGIDEHLGLEPIEMNAENVAAALDIVIEEANKLSENISYTPFQPTRLDKSFRQMSLEVLRAADKAADKYTFLQKYSSPAKPLAFSTPLAYTGISGIYGFFTGEANINTSFAPYSIPFTMAHEYSHQRGIGPEKEAEFSAFLICMESDDPYVRYSAYSQVAITLSNLLFEYDENLFYQAFNRFPDYLYYDIYHSSRTYEEYSKTALDEIASGINNVYLLSNADEGIVSYSLSAQLYVAYLLK